MKKGDFFQLDKHQHSPGNGKKWNGHDSPEIFTAVSMNITVFWDTKPYKY